MNKIWKNILSVGLAAGMVFGTAAALGGCDQNGGSMTSLREGEYVVTEKGEPVGFATLTFDYLGGTDVMPIGGYWGPYESGGSINGYKIPNLLSDKSFSIISEAGVNMIVRQQEAASFDDYASIVKSLEYGEKYNIGVFPQVSELAALGGRSTNYTAGSDLPFSEAGLERLLRVFASYDSFLGVSLTDEPFWYQMDGLERAYSLFQEMGYGEDYTMYTNALNYDATDETRGGWRPGVNIDVDTYYDRLFEDVNITFLSATGYFYTQKDTPDSQLTNLFTTLSALRNYANKYNVPLWRMLQAGGQWNDASEDLPSVPAYPDEGELLFDVNIALAYGCKAIQYFPLVQPKHFAYAANGGFDFNRSGIISAAGDKTQWFYYVQKANRQVAAVDHVLMNSANMGLIAHGENAVNLARAYDESRNEFLREGTFRQLTGVSGDDCYIGCFDYRGGTALYVVNYDRKEKSSVSLHFDDNYGYEVIQRATTAEVMGTRIDLTLECGEGVLVVLK